jgi:hypothetical protein
VAIFNKKKGETIGERIAGDKNIRELQWLKEQVNKAFR